MILVTGASGFVGRALVETLLGEGQQVVSMVRDRTKDPGGTAVVHGDVRDEEFCRRVIADYEVTAVYHLAAQAIVSACAEDPMTALDVAVMGTGRLLTAVRDARRPVRVIVSTSDKVYGSAPSPYTEETALDARHSYEVSKACQDLVARMFHSNYGVDVRVVRAVNIYGPADPNETRVIPNTIRRILKGEAPIIHAGAHAMRRQYVYIDDLVSALRVVAARGAAGEAYCVGSPSAPASVAEVIAEVTRQMRSDVEPEVKERGEHFKEIASQAVVDDKLRALDWYPQVKLEEGIKRTIRWYCDGEGGKYLSREQILEFAPKEGQA